MSAVKGADVLLFVNTSANPDLPTWEKVAFQRNAELSRSAETIESTTKDTENMGFKTFEAGMKEWEISAEALVEFENAGFQLLEDAFNENKKLLVQLKTEAGTGYEGEVVITDFPITFDYSDLATVSITMSGASALRKITGI